MSIARTGSPIVRMAARLFLVLAGFVLLAGSPADAKSIAEHASDVQQEHNNMAEAHAAAKQEFQTAAKNYTAAVKEVSRRARQLQSELQLAQQRIAEYQTQIEEFRGSTNVDDAAKIAAIRRRKRLAEGNAADLSNQFRQINARIQGLANELRDATRRAGRASQSVREIFSGEGPVNVVPLPAVLDQVPRAADYIYNAAGQAVTHHDQQQLANDFAGTEGRIRFLEEALQDPDLSDRQRQTHRRNRDNLIFSRRDQLEAFRQAERQYRTILSTLDRFHPDNRPPPPMPVQAQPPGPATAATLADGNVQYTAAPAAPQGQGAAAPTYDALSDPQMAPGGTHDYGGATSSTAAMAPVPPATAAHVNQGVVHHNQFQQFPVNQQPLTWDEI